MFYQDVNEMIVDSIYQNSYENLYEVEQLFKDIIVSYQLSHGDDIEGVAKVLSFKMKNGFQKSLRIFV